MLWHAGATSVHAQDGGVDGDAAASSDAGPPARSSDDGLPPFGCSVAGSAVSLGPALALVPLLAIARRRRRRA
ncbi:hypothetical protein [Sandaracinus amylolyticus]|uniref:hypothetical protein n=1 Tax=Sandaracinus amylolyticus TaxID=927083 RepID=UPI001F1B790F|nr:hypothetical protein [Sandaracinus amylolyticus]